MDVIHSICADVQQCSEHYYTTTGIISLRESYNLKPVPQKSGLPFRMACCIWNILCCNLVWLLLMGLLTHCGRVTQICVFKTVKLGTSASPPQCHFTRGNVSRGITPSSTTRVFGEYFLKISVHKNSQRICYNFLKKQSIKVD